MTLRYATLKDVDSILDMARELMKEGPYPDEFDEKYIRKIIEQFIITDNSKQILVVSVDEDRVVGVLAAYHFRPLFTPKRMAVEPLMYLHPDYRTSKRGAELLDAFEYWAKRAGARSVQLGRLVATDPRIQALYKRRGYKVTEEVYFKELD